jgi:hypothetical protein
MSKPAQLAKKDCIIVSQMAAVKKPLRRKKKIKRVTRNASLVIKQRQGAGRGERDNQTRHDGAIMAKVIAQITIFEKYSAQ